MAEDPKKNELKLANSIWVGNVVKAVIFCLFGLAVVVGNFFLENSLVFGEEIVEVEEFSIDYFDENIVPNRGVIRFADEDEFGFLNNVSVGSAGAEDSEDFSNEYILNLGSAKLWANFLVSDAKVNLVAGRAVFIPDHAVFDLEFDGDRILLSVFDGDVYVGFLEEGIELVDFTDEYSELFVNKLLVPRDTQVSIPLNKLDDRLKSLLYSKLVKEFKYAAVPSSLKDSDWVKTNINEDKKYIESQKQDFISRVIFKGVSVSDTVIGNSIFWVEENLTFVPEKKKEMVFDHLFSYLDDAIFYINEGDQFLGDYYWDEFNSYLGGLSNDISKSDEFYDRFDDYLDELSVFGPEDRLYFVFQKMLDKKFFEKRDVHEVVGEYWQGVYKGLDASDVFAEAALDDYYTYFDFTLGDKTDIGFYEDYITYQNQLFDNLFLRYSVFFEDGYFAIKNVLEQELLGLYDGGQFKAELSNAMISTKIDFLKRLRKFFFDGDVSVDEAKEILSRLVEEIDVLMPADSSGLAVIELFEDRLEDMGDFWGYLNSPEYHISKTYGTTHEEKYESYLVERDRIWSLTNIQEDILGEFGQEISVEDVENLIEEIFSENVDVSDVMVGNIENIDQRYVEVDGVIGGYPFKALYDRDQNVMRDVYVYGDLVSDRAVQLDNLLSLLKEKFADFVETDSGEDEYSAESLAQRVARLYVSELVSKVGIVVEMEDVSILDESSILYRIENVSIDGIDDVEITFDFMTSNEKATNLYLSVDGEPVVFDGEFTLEELKNIVFAESEFAPVGVAEGGSEGVLR